MAKKRCWYCQGSRIVHTMIGGGGPGGYEPMAIVSSRTCHVCKGTGVDESSKKGKKVSLFTRSWSNRSWAGFSYES